jgi:hypothetical protein
VIVISHAYAEDGVAEVLLSVNGTTYARTPPTDIDGRLVEVRQTWVPTAPGPHTLQVRTYDKAGLISISDQITIRVEGDPIDPTEGPTEIPTFEPTVPPTDGPTAVPTETPTPVPTDVPTALPTDVPTRVPTDVPTKVPTDVPTKVPTDVPTKVPTVKPTDLPDTDPPPVPTLKQPANDQVINPCPYPSEVTLKWNPVSDPSGPVRYYVKLELKGKGDAWQSVKGWGPIQQTQVVADVDCGIIYRWMVRAQDGAGNISAWSTAYTFSLSLD